MPIANCKRCGRIFNKVRRDICVSCIDLEDRAFLDIRKFLKEHPGANMSELVEGTGFDAELIIAMIQDGRIILRDNPNIAYPCQRCGGPTQTGRFCSQCAEELAAELSAAAASIREKKGQEKRGYHSNV